MASVVAVAAAVRSTWSPCGLSMLSTVTPMAEAARGNRYRTTAIWFWLGAVIGGATLGVAAAGLAGIVSLFDLDATAMVALAGAAAVLTAAIDLGLLGRPIPHHRRQVNEDWLPKYRSWVYGAGFGWQIGTGLTTYIMTAAVYLVIAMAALTGEPLTAFGLCILFGATRGAAVLLGARLTSDAALISFHARFDALREPVRVAVIAVQALVVALTVVLAGRAAAVAVGSALVVVAVAATVRSARRSPTEVAAALQHS